MSGPTLTVAQYDSFDDWTIWNVLLAPRNEETGKYITFQERIDWYENYSLPNGHTDDYLPGGDSEPAKDPIAKLGIPREALFMGVPIQYSLMWFAVWRRRGLPDDQILAKLKEKTREVPPWGSYSEERLR